MSRLLFVLPTVAAGATVRVDTQSSGTHPANITPLGGGAAVEGAKLRADAAGRLPRVFGPADGTATLYVKTLDYRGVVSGSPVSVTGIDEQEQAPASASAAIGDVVVLTLDVTVPGGDGNSKNFTISGTLPAGWTLAVGGDGTANAKVLLPAGVYSVAVQAFPNGSDVEAGSTVQPAIRTAALQTYGGFTGPLADGGDWNAYANVVLPSVPVEDDDGVEASLGIKSTGDMTWSGQLILCRIGDLAA